MQATPKVASAITSLRPTAVCRQAKGEGVRKTRWVGCKLACNHEPVLRQTSVSVMLSSIHSWYTHFHPTKCRSNRREQETRNRKMMCLHNHFNLSIGKCSVPSTDLLLKINNLYYNNLRWSYERKNNFTYWCQ